MIEPGSLYALLPADWRRRDAALGRPLQAFFDILEKEGAASIDADLDEFEDSLFVETCPEALLHEIGALIGAPALRPLPPEAASSQRAFLGNLLRYRRAKGTPAALEMLARDVTLYSARAVEYYARLSATPSMRAARLDRPTTARLGDPDSLARHGGAFDVNPRTPDMRSIARAGGRYNIPNVGVHLWRLEAPPFEGPDKDVATAAELAGALPMSPWPPNAGHFALLPAGGAEPLFMPQQNADRSAPRENETPDRLRRLPLRREIDALVAGTLDPGNALWFNPGNPAFVVYFRRVGEAAFRRVPTRSLRIGSLAAPASSRPAPFDGGGATGVEACVDPATGRLVSRAVDVANGFPEIAEVRLACALGRPGALGGGAYDRNDKDAAFEIARDGTVVLTVEPDAPNANGRFATLAAALAEWAKLQSPGKPANAGKRGFIVMTANATIDSGGDLALDLPAGCDLTIVAAEWRPVTPGPGDDADRLPLGYIVRRMRRTIVVARVKLSMVASGALEAGRVTLDGFLLLGGLATLSGAARAIDIRHCEVREAGGAPAIDIHKTAGQASLQIYRSIVGAIDSAASGVRIAARQSILSGSKGVAAPDAELSLDNVTVFGPVNVKTIDASNSIFLSDVVAAQTQAGCVRYSFIGGAKSRLPRRFRCQPDLAWEARAPLFVDAPPAQQAEERERLRRALTPNFVDTAVGEPAYGLLAMDVPAEISFGGENDGEMGAYGFLGGAARLANLADLFVDFVPFGIEAKGISADRSSVEASRRNRP